MGDSTGKKLEGQGLYTATFFHGHSWDSHKTDKKIIVYLSLPEYTHCSKYCI